MGERGPSPEEGTVFDRFSGWQRGLDAARGSPERRPRAPGLMGTLDTLMDMLAAQDPPDPGYASRMSLNGQNCDYQAYWPRNPSDPNNQGIHLAEFYKATRKPPLYRVELERDMAPDIPSAKAFKSEIFVLRFNEEGLLTDYRYQDDSYEVVDDLIPPIEQTRLTADEQNAFTDIALELQPTPQETLADLTTVLGIIEQQLWLDAGGQA